MKRTKIVATIGPSSEKEEILEEMIRFGMNVVRINFSHGTHESNGKMIDIVRKLGKKLDIPIGIMADLQGPRIRTVVNSEVVIGKDDLIGIYDISFDESKIKNQKSEVQVKIQKYIGLDVSGILSDIEVGNDILVEDGLMKIKVIEKTDNILIGKVISGGTVKNHKGVNIPDAKLKIPALTEKDKKDLEFALSKEVEFIALSFVSTKEDIENTQEIIGKILGRDQDLPRIVSKIERKEAIKNIDEIIEVSDVVMVARGDLGIEMAETKVVIYQKEIIQKCLAKNKTVIVATQMMQSMVENPLPTRAEVSDVTNAVIDHTDAVMLSGESANGKYPAKTVEVMSEIISETENSRFDDYVPAHVDINDHMVSDYASVIAAAWKMAKTSEAKAILAVSLSGFTGRLISNYRPEKLMLIATDNPMTFNQLSIVWGIEPYLFDKKEKIEDYIELILERAKKEKKLKKGDKVVVVLGRVPNGEKMKLVGIKEIE